MRQAETAALQAQGRADAEAELLPRIAALEERLASEQRGHQAQLADIRMAQETALQALQSAYAESIATLALEVTAAILATEPALAPDTVASLIAEALSTARPGDVGTLRLHPALAACAPELPAGWTLVTDPDIDPTTAIAEAGPSIALASLAHRLEQARTQL